MSKGEEIDDLRARQFRQQAAILLAREGNPEGLSQELSGLCQEVEYAVFRRRHLTSLELV